VTARVAAVGSGPAAGAGFNGSVLAMGPSLAATEVTDGASSRLGAGSDAGNAAGGAASAAGDLPTLPTAQAWFTTPRTMHAKISFVEFRTMV